jgi:hypothetical protein
MDIIVPKYSNKKTGSSRGNNVCYQLQLNGSKVQEVCKKYFINTFGVSERYCSTAWKTRDLLSGTPIPEQRGHHGNHKKIDDDLKNDIRAHIKSFPVIE